MDYSIYDDGVNPTINAAYFPNTRPYYFWSASPYAPSAGVAWVVDFYRGYGNTNVKGVSYAVRLVRGGQ